MDEIDKVIGDLRNQNNRLKLLLIGQNKTDSKETLLKIFNNKVEIKKLKKQKGTK